MQHRNTHLTHRALLPQAQHLPRAKHSSCWAVGQWGDGRKVSVSLLDPSDPTQGVVYTMLQGDSKGCPGGMCVALVCLLWRDACVATLTHGTCSLLNAQLTHAEHRRALPGRGHGGAYARARA